MIQEAYCSFEVARLLEEKGFEGDINAYYHILDNGNKVCSVQEFSNSEAPHLYIPAPTHQMAMKWLREVHNIHIEIYVIKNYDKEICKYTYTIMDLNFPGSDDGIDCCNEYKTYEQACESAIKYCLKRLVW